MRLPKKIFNRCNSIPFAKEIYKSRDGGIYRFCGIRDKRLRNEILLYSIPNNNSPKHPNIKGLQKQEIEFLWQHLLQNKKISTSYIKNTFPDLYKEGSCCIAAFFGIINTLYPKIFVKETGIIKFRKL